MTPELYHAAARRLVSQTIPDLDGAARRLVDGAARHEIDLALCYGTVEPRVGRKPAVVRQACLAVKGAGRTAMIFLSEPPPGGEDADLANAERVACVNYACGVLAREHGRDVRLAQALPEPHEDWAKRCLIEAKFIKVGDLRYLRRERGVRPPPADAEPWPGGVRVATLAELGVEWSRAKVDTQLMAALDRTYVDTLDCPELCGLRETSDVLDSHRKTGEEDPALWWLVFKGERPEGCMLLSRCPGQRTVELVYLGLSPALRGMGLGRKLLRMGVRRALEGSPGWSVSCAVDERNEAAIRLYESLGFGATGVRTAMVRPIGPKR